MEIPRTAGAYVLAVRLRERTTLDIPRLGNPRLQPGLYAYSGSARGPGGLAARIGRHLRPEKPRRWHIDWLTAAGVDQVYWQQGGDECAMAGRLMAAGATVPVPGFGSSDCRECPSHLLRLTTAVLARAAAGHWARSAAHSR